MANDPSVQWKFIEFFDNKWAWQRCHAGGKVDAMSQKPAPSYGESVRDAIKAGFSPKTQIYFVTSRNGFTTSHVPESALQRTRRHVRVFRGHVADQADRVEKSTTHDLDSGAAERLLTTMEVSLQLAESHLDKEQAKPSGDERDVDGAGGADQAKLLG